MWTVVLLHLTVCWGLGGRVRFGPELWRTSRICQAEKRGECLLGIGTAGAMDRGGVGWGAGIMAYWGIAVVFQEC